MVDFFKHFLFLKFKKSASEEEQYWRVLRKEWANFETGNHSEFSAVTTGSNSGKIELEYLEPADLEIWLVMFGVKDGCTYQMSLPANVERNGVYKDTGNTGIGRFGNKESPYYRPNPQFAIWLPMGMTPFVIAYNNTGKTVTPKLYCFIIKFLVEKVTSKDLIQKLNNREINSTQLEIGGISQA